ncbi:hypothetical protein [Pedobacter caeni]|uniref:Uncharacterized protein n=1 Tax=Pedobacter caeni TaxID=288992 RepID=A0A1M5JNU2_9SPHI|nr:hypothetical protein [Pedobacter caeni]SHG41950.1 hypothetical protein SAMN04488522_105437 [Pedobacter caeni]
MKKSNSITNAGTNSVFSSIRNRHILNLWVTIPLVLVCILIMTLILKEYILDFSLRSPSYIIGVLNILIGTVFLMRYNRLGKRQVDFYERITDSAMDYVQSIRKQIYVKRNSLIVNSLLYGVFLSTGLHLLIFSFMNEDILFGILGVYYGCFIALYGMSWFYISKRFKKEYEEILGEVCEE